MVRGLVGAYPNVLIEADAQDLPALAVAISQLASEADYAALLDRYGVRRTTPRFWPPSDLVHAKQRAAQPIAAGLLDYNRLENRWAARRHDLHRYHRFCAPRHRGLRPAMRDT